MMRTRNNRQTQVVICIAIVVLASSATALAQPPDNAALLYYQAFLLHEKPDDATDKMLDDFRKGKIAANDTIAKHIEKNRRAIDLVVTAANIAKCDWGYDYSQGVELAMPNLAQFRRMAFLLSAEARWLAAKGEYQTVLDRCVTMHKIALHACDKTLISYLVGIAIDTLANRVTEDVLGLMPPDVDALNRLKSDLAQTAERFPSQSANLAQEAQVCTATMNKDQIQTILKMAREAGDDSASKEVIERLSQGDEAFFERNRNYWFSSMAKMQEVLELKLPYAQMCTRLDELGKQLNEEMKGNPDATLTTLSFSPAAIRRVYQLTIRKQTHFNAILAAIDLYIAQAQTGRLPDALPAGSAPDLFSGEPFAYTKTAKGFMLRCPGKEDPTEDKVHEFEFKISK